MWRIKSLKHFNIYIFKLLGVTENMPRTLVGGWCLASRSFSNSYSFVSGLNAKWWPKSRKASTLGSSPLRGKFSFQAQLRSF